MSFVVTPAVTELRLWTIADLELEVLLLLSSKALKFLCWMHCYGDCLVDQSCLSVV